MQKPNFIHPTALIDPSAHLGSGNHIGPFCVIGPGVSMGDNNHLVSHCSIGTPPEHREYWFKEHKSVVMGSGCMVREFVTINSGTSHDTTVGDDVIFLRGSHVGHDSVVHSEVTFSCNVLLGGHSVVFKGANLGLGCVLHQFSKVGHYAMLGMGAVVTKTTVIEPGGVYVGSPARFLKENLHAIRRKNLSSEDLRRFRDEFSKWDVKAAA